MKIYRSLKGKTMRLGSQRGAGGEGEVWEVIGRPNLLAKTYHRGCSSTTEAKLKAMLDRPPAEPRGHTSVAWPKDLLYDGATCVGYVMPYMRDAATTIFNFEHPAARKKRFPTCNRRHLYQMGVNLSSALELVHHAGHVVGDFNEANILARPNGLLTFIDTDSFQISDGTGRIYRCGVGRPEMIAPEIQGKEGGEFDWNVEHDRFALAVHLFYLLVGVHPFNGVLTSGAQVESIDVHLIRAGVFPYCPNSVAKPPPKAVKHYERLAPGLRNEFERTFVAGNSDPSKRLPAAEWWRLLTDAQKALAKCRQCRTFNEPHLMQCFECGADLPAVQIGWQERVDAWDQKVKDWWWEYRQRALASLSAVLVIGIGALYYTFGSSPSPKAALGSAPSSKIVLEPATPQPVVKTVELKSSPPTIINQPDRGANVTDVIFAAQNMYNNRVCERDNKDTDKKISEYRETIARAEALKRQTTKSSDLAEYEDTILRCQNEIDFLTRNKENIDPRFGFSNYVQALDALTSVEQIKDGKNANDLQKALVKLVKRHAQLRFESRLPDEKAILADFDNLAITNAIAKQMEAPITSTR